MIKTKSVTQKGLFLVILALFFSFDKVKLTRIKVTADISVAIPKDWHPMDQLDFSERYPSVRAPLAAFTDENRLTDFSVNISATRWPDTNLEVAKSFFKASILNSFDRVEMINEGIREVKGVKFLYFEFESTVRGKGETSNRESILKYSHLQYLIEPNRTLVFSFHCPRRARAEWQETALTLMENIRVK